MTFWCWGFAKITKAKDKQVELYHIKSFCTAKENYQQNEKAIYRIHVSNPYVVWLKLIQCYTTIIFQNWEENASSTDG